MCCELQYLFEFDISGNFQLFTYCEVVPVITRDLHYFILRAKKSSQTTITLT